MKSGRIYGGKYMRISNSSMNQIVKSGNIDLISKVAMNNGSFNNFLTREEAKLLQKEREAERTKKFLPSSELVFVHTLDRDQDQNVEMMDSVVSQAEMMYHIYNMGYNRPLDETMDDLTKYAKGIGISRNKLRFAVENIDKDYLVKYESQYSEAIRGFLSEDDLSSIATDPELAVYYQEQEKEEEEEEETLESYGLYGFSF